MEDFETRRKEYFKKLRTYPRVLDMMINGGKDDKERFKTLEVITAPTNEFELELAECLFDYTKDVVELFGIMMKDEFYDRYYHNNEMLKLEINLVNLLKNGGDIETVTSKYEDPKMAARLMYDSIICPPFINEILYYVGIWTGFDISDGFECLQLVSLLEQSKDLIKEFNTDKMLYGMEDVDRDKLDEIKIYTSEFHKLCTEGRTNTKDNIDVYRLYRRKWKE